MKILIICTIMFALIFFLTKREEQAPKGKTKSTKSLSLLKDAHCVMNEKSIKTSTPVPLHGRVDQVFQLKDKRLLLLDTKDRKVARVYPSDVAQLSVYATILKHNGHDVCPFAYIRFPRKNDKAIYILVDLYSESRIIALYHKFTGIKNGKYPARCTCGKHTM